MVAHVRDLYDADELDEWVPRIRQAAGQVKNVHPLMNNCYAKLRHHLRERVAALLESAD